MSRERSRHRHHQSARDDRRLGARDRPADSQRHRLAGPAHRPSVCRDLQGEPGTPAPSRPRPASSSTPISRPRRSPGSSTRWRARAPRPRTASSPSAPSTASCSGVSPAGASTRPTPPTPAARRSSTSRPAIGTTSLLDLFRVPRALLPEVRDCAARFGETEPEILGAAIPDHRHRRRPAGGDRRPGAASSPA